MEMFLTIKLCTYVFWIEQIIYIEMDLALNNLQRLICHKTQQTKPNNNNNNNNNRKCKHVFWLRLVFKLTFAGLPSNVKYIVVVEQ